MEKKTVGIVGAGISGLLACKYALQKGFQPLVFEAGSCIGGVWSRTIRTTKLQTIKSQYQFVDFPWPEEVREECPAGAAVKAYIESYALHFDLLRHIRFGSCVTAIDYVASDEEEMNSWDQWAGTGEAFRRDGRGSWQLTVEHAGGEESATASEIHEVDFLILCIGRFSGLPNMPSFPPNRGPEVFRGKVLHSMDYYAMDHSAAIELSKGKRTVVVGFSKSAIDIAVECSNANGASHPCTLMFRESRWVAPNSLAWRIPVTLFYLTRFAELFVHKPGEEAMFFILATLLSPLLWLISKILESYCKLNAPLVKFGPVPDQSITEEMASTTLVDLQEGFYDRMEDGTLIPKKSASYSFCENGIIADDGILVPADVVIFATGFKGDEKIRKIFSSPKLQRTIMGSTCITIPLFRGCIHPRIPQLAVIGYSESYSNLHTSEMRCIWLMHFLDGGFRLPTIRCMEEDVMRWQEYMKRYCRSRSSIGALHRWYNEQLCKDMGYDPTRGKGLLGWFVRYQPQDYRELAS